MRTAGATAVSKLVEVRWRSCVGCQRRHRFQPSERWVASSSRFATAQSAARNHFSAAYSKTASCAFLSSLQPRNVVCRNWSSAVSSAYTTSQTNFGRTHWIFSLMLGGLANGHLSMKSGCRASGLVKVSDWDLDRLPVLMSVL